MSEPLGQTAPIEYRFKTDPFNHQREEWEFSRDLEARAIFWEQGTGKSKLTIDTACWLWLNGRIDAVVVVAPNGVHRNWVEGEIPDHVPDDIMRSVRALYFQSPKADAKWHKQAVRALLHHPGFAWLTISYDAFMTNAGKRTLIDFFDRRRVLYVLDEGHNIKSIEAERTVSILKSAKYAPYRRVLTGTPIAQGPFDAFTQIKFLDERFWDRHDLGTFTEFKSYFATWKKGWNPHAVRRVFDPVERKWNVTRGVEVPILESYRRLDELNAMLKPISSRVTKDDVLDLPPKLYTKAYFEMTKEQARLYDQMRDEYMVWLESGDLEREAEELLVSRAEAGLSCATCTGRGEIVSDGFIYQCPDCSGASDDGDPGRVIVAELAMTRLLRLQQITCGYIPTGDEADPLHIIPGPNRRLELLCDQIERRQHKTIVWARFQMDVTLILQELTRRGIRAVRYDGLSSDDERAEAKARFQGERSIVEKGQVVGREKVPESEQADVFVGNPAAGATGLTLTVAAFTDYYSNSFKLIDRLQSEDRAHRIGQKNQVLYTDYIAEGTVDEKIVAALRSKFNIASQITGDRLKDWI